MNRVEFIGQTNQGTLISLDDIVRYFDNTMAAYEVVGEIDNISVYGNTDDYHHSLSLRIESSDIGKLNDVVKYINDTIHNHQRVYEKNFRVDCSSDGCCVNMFVREEL